MVKKIIKKEEVKKEPVVKKGGKIIIVVDDEADNRSTVKSVLEKEGYKVVTAVSGDDCLKKVEAGVKPNLILMDIMMPGTPVKEIVPKLGKFKIAYLSVVRMGEAQKEELLKSSNIVAFIQKPFDIDELVKKVKKLTG